eukprot:TRINITY_DN24235_c0_g1_i1.p1 TRINITY_DN24235_c0_g1~~TRINITY_DN24235_c0_g1_i1.p1  ORF type:complete len:148 (+),score=40.64 TRINITY_DN24235_c0_g1_i1:49-444(+)
MSDLKVYTMDEVAKHNTLDDLWIAVCGRVFHLKKEYLDDHPGGRDVLMSVAGRDATEQWIDVKHSKGARTKMAEFLVGKLEGADESNVYTDPSYVWPEQIEWEKRKTTKKTDYTPFIIAILVLAIAYLALN